MGFENVRKAKIAGDSEALSKMGAAGGRQAAANRLRRSSRASDEAAALAYLQSKEFHTRAVEANEHVVPLDSSDEVDK